MQTAGMTTITIRDVPDETHAELAARAALAGQSLQEYLRAKLVEVAERPDAKTLIARARARKHVTHTLLPAEKILSYRDSDRP
jgi:antitoxin FitA